MTKRILTAFLAGLLLAGCSPRITPQSAKAAGWIRVTLVSVERTSNGYLYSYASDAGTNYERRIRHYVSSLVGACYLIDPKTSRRKD